MGVLRYESKDTMRKEKKIKDLEIVDFDSSRTVLFIL